MKKIRNLFYLLGQGFIGIFRNSNMTLASILILICCMLTIGIFGSVIKIIDLNSNFDNLNIVVAYVNTDTDLDEAKIEEIQLKIEGLTNVTDVVFISKEEAKKRMEDKGFDDINELLAGHNPLPATFEISFDNPDQAHIVVNNVNKIEEIVRTVDKMSDIEKISGIKRAIMIIALVMMSVLMVVALFVIMNAVKLGVFARRNEITVMRYIGATNNFIIMPFIIEGLLIGLISAALAVGIQFYLYTYVIADVLNNGLSETLIAPGFSYFVWGISALFVAIGIFTGIFASSASVKRYLKA